MIIKLTRRDWNDLQLDDEKRYQQAIIAFYCGYGLNWTRRLLDIGCAEEWEHLTDLATMLGLDFDQDRIEIL